MTTKNVHVETDVEVVVRGDLPAGVRERAHRMVGALARYTSLRLQHARVRLTHHGDPARKRPVTAQASVDFDGRRIRAQVEAVTAAEALDLLTDVLRHRLSRLAEHWEARRGAASPAAPYEWRHVSEHTHRPAYSPRPVQEREVIRHKVFGLEPGTPDEAIEEMELAGYAFRLFTDRETGQDSVVYRSGPDGYRLAQVKPVPGRTRRTAAAMTTRPYPAARLGLTEAIERLELTGWPFVFYTDPASGRGRVLYRRYDGHYGLIAPLDE